MVPKTPNAFPVEARCDIRLPEAALAFRMKNAPPLIDAKHLGSINITAWLYRDTDGIEKVQVNPNTTISELLLHFGPAATPDAEVGIHSEGKAAEWFRVRPELTVLQIFSERVPCRKMCGPLLKHYFPGVPWFYYYDRNSWRGSGGRIVRSAGEVLKSAYGL